MLVVVPIRDSCSFFYSRSLSLFLSLSLSFSVVMLNLSFVQVIRGNFTYLLDWSYHYQHLCSRIYSLGYWRIHNDGMLCLNFLIYPLLLTLHQVFKKGHAPKVNDETAEREMSKLSHKGKALEFKLVCLLLFSFMYVLINIFITNRMVAYLLGITLIILYLYVVAISTF